MFNKLRESTLDSESWGAFIAEATTVLSTYVIESV